MKNYLLSIIAVSLSAAALFHLLPGAAFQKSLKFLCALLLLLSLFAPLSGASGRIGDFFSYDWLPDQKELEDSYTEKSKEALLAHSKEYLEGLIKERVTKEFSIRDKDLSVRLLFEDDEPNEIVLILSGKAIWQDSAALEAFAEDLLGLPCSSFIE
ncbi:MAG: hypothetical protein IJR88_04160 [Clostridia bacterium]|nr:hypothetical protein [Clostridia bacterium]